VKSLKRQIDSNNEQIKSNKIQIDANQRQRQAYQQRITQLKLINQLISEKLDAYQKVGLAGFSGSGKTTFTNLITRLFDIEEGRILIDGQDIKLITQDSLRRNISIIPQEPILFHRSIIENIKYGTESATYEEVVAAAKSAYIHDFINKLPDGYNTLCGERGNNLSGGQRQRIIIARAILKNAPILILDEATSALDNLTENLIQRSLKTLMKGKTVLVIAHRLSTLLNMDRILVFDNGHIVEDGIHNELKTNGKLYQQLWNAQKGGSIAELY
jgi:ABC-type multidrug transport system fused ATPase/permease subunit